MRRSDRLSLLVIGAALLLLAPMSIANMSWDRMWFRLLPVMYKEVVGWFCVFLGGAAILLAVLTDDDDAPPRP